MRKITILFSFLMSVMLANGQNDPQAKAILDQVSAKNKAYKTVRTNFTLNISNTQNNEKSTQKGSLLLKGDKYVIKMPESEIYFDGKDVYNYLPQSKEVNITKPKPASKKGDDFSFNNPKEILKIYEKDFKYKYLKESMVAGKTVYEIDLYPVDLQKKYSRIRLQIDKATSQLVSVKAFLKDGQQYALNFDTFEINKDLADSLFSFDPKIHPGIEIIDLRF